MRLRTAAGKCASLNFDELKQFLLGKEIAKYKLPERLEIMQDFPLSTVRQSFQEDADGNDFARK